PHARARPLAGLHPGRAGRPAGRGPRGSPGGSAEFSGRRPMMRIAAVLGAAVVALAACGFAVAAFGVGSPQGQAPVGVAIADAGVAGVDADAEGAAGGGAGIAFTAPPVEPRFVAIDVTLDTEREPLAAYQFELTADQPGVRIVGLE